MKLLSALLFIAWSFYLMPRAFLWAWRTHTEVKGVYGMSTEVRAVWVERRASAGD